MRARQPQRGFTLIELMISLVLFSFAIAGALSIAVSLTNGYREQRQAVATEMAVRAPMDFISDAIRSATPAIPSGAVVSGITEMACDATPCNGAPGTPIKPTIQDTQSCQYGAIWMVDGGTGATDELYVTYASGAVITRPHSPTVGTTFDPSVGTSISVANPTGIQPGDYLLVTDGNQGTIVQVSSTWVNPGYNANGTSVTLVAPNCTSGSISVPAGGYGDSALVIRVYRAHFYIDTTSYASPFGGFVPTLMMDPDSGGPAAAEPLAENIEDMQISLGIDVDGNGNIDPTEWAYSATTPGALAGEVRAVRITLTARASQTLIGNYTNDIVNSPFFYRGAENRGANIAHDGYRRRVLTSTIEVRNTGGSP